MEGGGNEMISNSKKWAAEKIVCAFQMGIGKFSIFGRKPLHCLTEFKVQVNDWVTTFARASDKCSILNHIVLRGRATYHLNLDGL